MKNHQFRILFIVMLCAGLAAVMLIGFGLIAQNRADRISDDRIMRFQMDWAAMGENYLQYGAGQEAQHAMDVFLDDIPVNLRGKTNVVIVDRNGTIRLKANNKFLHSESDELTMAWDSYAVIFDRDGITKYWIRLTGESIAESDSGFVRTAGASRMGLSQAELRSMIHDYWKNTGFAEAEVEITYIGNQKSPMYMLWFMDLGVYQKVYESLGLNAGLCFMKYVQIGCWILLLYWLLAPVWVFLDARRRQTQPLPWALLVLLTNVVGLIVYWIVQTQNGKAPPALACPACGKPVKKGYPYCPWCAAPLVKACKSCGKTLEPLWTACPWCGKPIE